MVIGRNVQNQSNKQFDFNPKRCGPKGWNKQCSQETPNHEKLRMPSTLTSRLKKISPKNRREYDQEKTVAEIEKTVKSSENNKSPGNDGLPAELYKTFNEILKTDLDKLYIKISELGEMSRSIRQAVISCLYKKGDREDIANWQPISLLNYDNKIYTKILANNIQPTLEDIVRPEQTTSKKGRIIIENLQLNRNVMSYTNANKIQTTMIALDQEKAFDKVE